MVFATVKQIYDRLHPIWMHQQLVQMDSSERRQLIRESAALATMVLCTAVVLLMCPLKKRSTTHGIRHHLLVLFLRTKSKVLFFVFSHFRVFLKTQSQTFILLYLHSAVGAKEVKVRRMVTRKSLVASESLTKCINKKGAVNKVLTGNKKNIEQDEFLFGFGLGRLTKKI